MPEPAVCLYHDDADGRCSAAIVRRALGAHVQLFAMEYGDAIPWQAIDTAVRVIVVDFSLPLPYMRRIHNQTELIWIDHHKTSIETLGELKDLPGMRAIDEAACVLTWETFFPDQPIPEPVLYIGDRDIWRYRYQETGNFSEGLYHEDTHPSNDALWEPLLSGDEELTDELIARGRILHQAKLVRIERDVSRFGLEVTFEGQRTLAVNLRGSGDIGERIRQMGYTIAYCYFEAPQNGQWKTFVTLYSDQVDVSEIARKFGGGGHVGAAGFSFERTDTPFPPEARIQE